MYTFKNITLSKLSGLMLDICKDLKDESWMTTHQVSIVNYENQNNWYASLTNENVNNPRNLVLQGEISGDLIGIFKIFNIDYVNRTADVAWDVFSKFRGQGFGKILVAAGTSFCFDVLALRRLNAEILDGNEKSAKCALEAGFMIEGLKRQAVHKLGNYVDSRVYGLLVSEWKNGGIGKPTEK